MPRRSYSSMKLSLTILELPWRSSFSFSTPRPPPPRFAYLDHFSIAYRALRRTPGFRETFPFERSKSADAKILALALYVAPRLIDRLRIQLYTHARKHRSYLLPLSCHEVRILHFYRYAIFCSCLRLISL